MDSFSKQSRDAGLLDAARRRSSFRPIGSDSDPMSSASAGRSSTKDLSAASVRNASVHTDTLTKDGHCSPSGGSGGFIKFNTTLTGASTSPTSHALDDGHASYDDSGVLSYSVTNNSTLNYTESRAHEVSTRGQMPSFARAETSRLSPSLRMLAQPSGTHRRRRWWAGTTRRVSRQTAVLRPRPPSTDPQLRRVTRNICTFTATTQAQGRLRLAATSQCSPAR